MRPFGFLRLRGCWVLLAHFGTAPVHAQAPAHAGPRLANTELQVQRSAEAQDCPDTDQLAAELSAPGAARSAPGAARSAPPVLQQIHVNFSRVEGEYTAELTMSGWRTGRRAFSSADSTCAGVLRATVLAIDILLDPNVEAAEEADGPAPLATFPPAGAEPAPTEGATGEAAAPAHAENAAPVVPAPVPPFQPQASPVFPPARPLEPPPPAAPPQPETLWAGAGLGVVSDFVEWSALTYELGVRWRLSRTAFEFAGFITTPDNEHDGVGETQVMFLGTHTRACLTWPPGVRDVLELYLCAQLSAAAIRGSAKGYDSVDSAQYQPWLAAGPVLQLTGAANPALDWRVLAAFPLAITRESYVVETEPGTSRTAFTTELWSFWLGVLVDLPIL